MKKYISQDLLAKIQQAYGEQVEMVYAGFANFKEANTTIIAISKHNSATIPKDKAL